MYYLDTSLLVSAFSHEATIVHVQEWLQSRPEKPATSEWTIVEFSSAMSIKVRTGQISISLREEALRSFAAFQAGMILLPVTPGDFRLAARFSEHHETGIRANDALHLAVAHAFGATLCTLDRRLAKAGPQLGVAAELVA